MRRTIIVVSLLALLGACEQKRTETQTTVGTSGTVSQQTSTVTTTTPSVDTAATARAVEKTETAAREAARQTGTAMETAGKEIQRRTKKH